MHNISIKLLAAGALALVIPCAVNAQSGATTSGYQSGSGSAPASDSHANDAGNASSAPGLTGTMVMPQGPANGTSAGAGTPAGQNGQAPDTTGSSVTSSPAPGSPK